MVDEASELKKQPASNKRMKYKADHDYSLASYKSVSPARKGVMKTALILEGVRIMKIIIIILTMAIMNEM